MKLGNIIYQEDLVNHEKVDFVNYIKEPIEYQKYQTNLPTLYVGWRFFKESNPNDIIIQPQSILEKKVVTNQLYWEHSFKENKSQHVLGVEMFINDVPYMYFTSKYNYYNIDPVFFQIQNIDDLFNVLPKNIDAYYNYKGEMLYILKDSVIWGIDIKMYEYFEFDIENILFKISKKSTIFFTDLDGETYQKYYKTFPDFDYLRRYIVVLLSK